MILTLSRYTRDGILRWQVLHGGTPLCAETDETTARSKLEAFRRLNGRSTVTGWDGDKCEHFAVP